MTKVKMLVALVSMLAMLPASTSIAMADTSYHLMWSDDYGEQVCVADDGNGNVTVVPYSACGYGITPGGDLQGGYDWSLNQDEEACVVETIFALPWLCAVDS